MAEKAERIHFDVDVLDVSGMDYPRRVLVASLQGLVNRGGPRLFLDYGIYDDESARTTNEPFLPDAIWHAKFRDAIGNQNRANLTYYRSVFDLRLAEYADLNAVLRKHAEVVHGVVVWDPDMPDTVNVALMLCGLNDLVAVHPDLLKLTQGLGLPVVEDLRGRWSDRVALYEWAFEHLFPRCRPGQVACVEPGWERPEFYDYLVQNRIFTYSLTAKAPGRRFALGQTLLLLLVGGPPTLRRWLFELGLDGPVKAVGLRLMGWSSKETRLATRILRAVEHAPFATIFGWHTKRDDELSFMVLLSANGLRLVPSHLAGNFSFHSRLPAAVPLKQDHATPKSARLDADKVYLTFTLSDGDQLMMMSTGELGNWRRPERGAMPFNWEVQPLLADLAPALLGQYFGTRTFNDYLMGGPSGAGYCIPPLMPKLEAYLQEASDVCRRADVRVFTSYIADPPMRVIRHQGRAPGDFIGYLAGYFHFGRWPMHLYGGRAFVANAWPQVDQLWDDSDTVLAWVREQVEAPGPTPRFIGVHLFAYRTTLKDVVELVRTLDARQVKVVRADEFLLAAAQYMLGHR